MARNKFDVDERLETPFDFKHFKRAMVYVKRYKWKMILALSLSAISAIVALIGPLLTKEAVDVAIPDGNIPYIVFFVDRLFAVYNCQRCTRKYPSAYYDKSRSAYDIRYKKRPVCAFAGTSVPVL